MLPSYLKLDLRISTFCLLLQSIEVNSMWNLLLYFEIALISIHGLAPVFFQVSKMDPLLDFEYGKILLD